MGGSLRWAKDVEGIAGEMACERGVHIHACVFFVFTSKSTRKDTSKKGGGQGLREGANARGDNTKH